MDRNWHPAVQVVINGHPQAQAHTSGGPPQRRDKPLSVEEALQYSPMSSSPIFGLDCILRPDVGRPPNTTSINHILQSGRTTLTELNGEVSSGRDESSLLETSREYLQQLLDGDQLTEFKFKIPITSRNDQHSLPTTSSEHTSSRSNLGSFTRMMLESTDIAFRYPTPSQAEDEKRSQKAISWNSKAHAAIKSTPASYNQHNHMSSNLSVVIPIKPIPPDVDDRAVSKRRKLNIDGDDNIAAIRLKDQKEEADAALVKLQDLLHEIFEAEDQLEPGMASATTAEHPNAVFSGAQALDISGSLLSSDAHSRLQKAIRKVVGFNRLQDIPSDYLNRIQKLCEKPVIAAQSPDLRLEDPSNDSEAQEWLKKIDDMHNALLAVGTLLLTMSGSQTERDLCPEDLIEAIPNVLNQTFDHCVIPAVEARPGGKEARHFEFFSAQKRVIGGLIQQSKKALALFADFLARIDVSEGTVTAAEFFACKLIFVENSHTEKDSAVGFQKYESVRRGAMDVLAKVFSKYPAQRPFILDEILVSLEKLPSTRQSARQFKLADGKNIQLLTALVMQLVQTTALDVPISRSSRTKSKLPPSGDEEEEGEQLDDARRREDDDESELTMEQLATKVNRLYDNAVRSAQYIVKFIVQRAMTSTKTGDQPYRNILDLFTEDLIGVLGSTDWPAAELLLRIMASHMVGIADLDKSPATAKSMALELLGWMGSAISDLIVTAQHLLPTMEESDSELTDYLKQLFEDYSGRALHPQDLVVAEGPYRMTLEYFLQVRHLDDWQLTSARGYYLAQWAKSFCSVYYNADEREDVTYDDMTENLVDIFAKLFSDPLWLETHKHFNNVSAAHGRFSYIMTVLNSSFCKAFDTILKVLLNSIASDQAKVRSRSLKSVIYMLEKDPSLLDRDTSVMRVILRCATDASPMVRDSALSLIAKCISLKPKLEEDGCRSILTCAADPTAGVRKRCIGLLKDIYLKTSRTELKLAILDSFLQRTGDLEESVSTLARQTFEEIWLAPFYELVDSAQDGPKLKVGLGERVTLFVSLVQRSETALETLGGCLRKILSDSSKSSSSNFKVCKAMVSTMFEKLVEDSDAGKEFQQALLQTITVFAKANAKLFRPDQLETLHPYIGHLETAEDLFLFRSVVVIYRCVLPYLSSAHNTLLKEVQNDLFKSVAKLARSELNEVMACLWTINGVLQNTDRLVKLTISVLKPIQHYKNIDLSDNANMAVLARAKSYIRIAGCVGRHCDLEKYEPHFKNAFPSWNGGSVAGLMVNSIIPFTLPKQPLELRVMALESLGSICQSWPAQFSRDESRRVLSMVFKEDNPSLQNIVLRAFADFFAMHEGKAEKSVLPSAEALDQESTTRLGGSLKASDNDGAAALIAQHFLQNMLRVAQSRQDSYALTAIELIASINRQGLVHPKECAGVLVSLETSTVPSIAKVAFETHKMLHQQYESMFEREYMRAVQEAFYYQRDVVGDSTGALSRPYVAKLAPLFEIIKISNSRYQKKFLSNLCAKVNFELKKLDTTGNPPEHLLLARFVAHNLAFFEYAQLSELVPTIGCMERIVASTGTAVAHAIETELFSTSKLELPQGEGVAMPTADPPSHLVPLQQINQQALRQLATAAAALSMLWEARTYLRRVYGVTAHVRNKEAKAASKELNKSATKVHGVTGDKCWDAINRNMMSLDSEENMVSKCREFATLLAIDDEFKVDDDMDAEGDDGVTDMDDPAALGNPSGPRPMKRKSSMSGQNPTKRPRGRKPGSGKKRASTESDAESDWN
ncbi:sister chromatid cohesion C-terminus-domain-containing protein [Aspergillus pseudonomiae]|uniref:Sister chromatid cohesion protein n=1 Tax=Aspergillus pseudonomiae TaxID=1506151 RepID=A0A5N6IDE7_9EURO|nr:sister chromatid cohesion C-terminus-domain-containing protein [Aspergillus pseudonomiae]KAB8263810.1 sister chromatid cohesion C-terminus-domain-containing protein [Aspergillus pseudonomiae]KAE8405114.1 sister chromatid cohesion C-terminus-domain-containing protein [Aspergillus pseudonomiae]